MTKTYDRLPTQLLAPDASYVHPHTPPELTHLHDPALQVMFDFHHLTAAVIKPDSSIDDALLVMRVCQIPVLLVVNPNHHVIGLISTEDILGEKPVKLIKDKQMRHSEIAVAMVMTPQNQIVIFELDTLRHAKVGHIVATLRELKQHYALVVDSNQISHQQLICGLFSLSQISKQLGIDISNELSEAHSIAELKHELDLP